MDRRILGKGELPEETKSAGRAMLLRGLAAETAAAFFLFAIDTTIQTKSDEQVETLRSTNLVLEAQIQPRRLDSEEMLAMVAVLSRFAGKTVKISSHPFDMESAILGMQVITVLKNAHITPFDRRMTRQTFGAVGWGVVVSGRDQEFVNALIQAFPARLGAAAGEPPSGYPTLLSSGEDAVAVDATIFVGVKPLPPATPERPQSHTDGASAGQIRSPR